VRLFLLPPPLHLALCVPLPSPPFHFGVRSSSFPLARDLESPFLFSLLSEPPLRLGPFPFQLHPHDMGLLLPVLIFTLRYSPGLLSLPSPPTPFFTPFFVTSLFRIRPFWPFVPLPFSFSCSLWPAPPFFFLSVLFLSLAFSPPWSQHPPPPVPLPPLPYRPTPTDKKEPPLDATLGKDGRFFFFLLLISLHLAFFFFPLSFFFAVYL